MLQEFLILLAVACLIAAGIFLATWTVLDICRYRRLEFEAVVAFICAGATLVLGLVIVI